MSNIVHSQERERPRVLEHVGDNLRRYRRLRGLSQDALAEASGVSRRMIVNLEAGDANVSLQTLDRLAEALDARFADLVSPDSSCDRARIDAVAWAGASSDSSGTLLATAPAAVEAEVWRWSLAPGEQYRSEGNAAGWHEIIYVTEGELVIAFADGERRIAAGDYHAASLDSPRLYANRGEAIVRFVRTIVH